MGHKPKMGQVKINRCFATKLSDGDISVPSSTSNNSEIRSVTSGFYKQKHNDKRQYHNNMSDLSDTH